MFREFSACAAQTHNIIDPVFMPKGLHDMGEAKMAARLQAEIDAVDTTRYEAILLGYALCNNGVRGLRSTLPMVLPRAHDCITLLLGSRAAYKRCCEENAGTFYRSPGWIERDTTPGDNPDSITSQLGMNRTYDEYAAKYGEEEARYLMEVMGNWERNYTRVAYIDTVGDAEFYRAQARAEALKRGWTYADLPGDINLLQRLLDGDWDARDFLVIPPTRTLAPTFDDNVIGLATEEDYK
jgi:hypothetical protein